MYEQIRVIADHQYDAQTEGSKSSNSCLLWAVYQICEASGTTARWNYPWVSKVVPCDCPRYKPTEPSDHKNVKCTSHSTSKFERGAVIRFLTLKGLRPRQIQTEVSDLYHEQAFRLPAAEKWHICFADKTRDLKDDPRPDRPKKTDVVAQLHIYFVRSHLGHARQSIRD
jgi:hypothetical protein